jgi:hypothetical protein
VLRPGCKILSGGYLNGMKADTKEISVKLSRESNLVLRHTRHESGLPLIRLLLTFDVFLSTCRSR